MSKWILRSVTGAIVASMAVLALAGCSAANDQLSQQFKNGDNKNYIQGDGTVSEWAKSSRKAAVDWKGVTESGDVLSSSSLTGVVTVLNFWYAGCAPCRAEAPDLHGPVLAGGRDLGAVG